MTADFGNFSQKNKRLKYVMNLSIIKELYILNFDD